ncbi:hypothetical protein cypCar_00026694, partial [Cyprinus carpio]
RTSSQYVASAIAKNNSIPNTKTDIKQMPSLSTKCAVRKPTYNNADNEHSALLSAIRAPSNSARLKKVS